MIWKFFYDTIMGFKTPKKDTEMKNLLLGSLSLAAILAFSGCGGSEPKSIEELQKLSQDELKEISAKCGSVIDEPKNDEELNKKYLEIATKIVNARGQENFKSGVVVFGDVVFSSVAAQATDEEVSKFGDSDFAKYTECVRVRSILEQKSMEDYKKARNERYKKMLEDTKDAVEKYNQEQ